MLKFVLLTAEDAEDTEEERI